jgi:hypothetical protein
MIVAVLHLSKLQHGMVEMEIGEEEVEVEILVMILKYIDQYLTI